MAPETSRATLLSVVLFHTLLFPAFPGMLQNRRDCAVYNRELFIGAVNAEWTMSQKANNNTTYVTSLWTAGGSCVSPPVLITHVVWVVAPRSAATNVT